MERTVRMEDKEIVEIVSTRFAVLGSKRAMNFYRWFGEKEESNRFLARRRAAALIDLWQCGTELRSRPFMPGESTQYGNDRSTLAEWEHFYSSQVRLFFLAVQAQTSKVALDAALDGYYTQSFILLRTMLESWRRCVLMRRSHVEALRWIPKEDIPREIASLDGFRRPKVEIEANAWKSAFPCDTNAKQLEADRVLRDDCALRSRVKSMTEYLNSHVHPTLEGASQLLTNPDMTVLHPDFSEPHLMRCLEYGCTTEFLLIRETSLLLNLPSEWEEEFNRWWLDFTSAQESITSEESESGEAQADLAH